MTTTRRLRTLARSPLAALLFSAVIVGCSEEPVSQTTAPQVIGERIHFAENSPQLHVLRSEPVNVDATPSLELPARLAWDDTRTGYLHALASGQVATIDTAPGDRVSRGQPMAWIVSPDLGLLQADQVRSRAELDQARKALARVRELHAAGVAAGRDLDEAEAAVATTEAEHVRASAGVQALGGNGRIDQRLPLRAPIDGIVVEHRLSPGMTVTTDGDRPLVVVSDPDHLWLLLDIPEHKAANVRVGMPVTVTGNGHHQRTTLQHVADYIDDERRVLTARAELGNGERHFKAGQLVRATVHLPDDNGVSVPARSVLQNGGHQVVFVEEGTGQYRRQPVEAQLMPGGMARITAGVGPDTRVVVDGSLLLQQLVDTAAVTANTDSLAERAP